MTERRVNSKRHQYTDLSKKPVSGRVWVKGPRWLSACFGDRITTHRRRNCSMKRSTDRILTTHAGRLPNPSNMREVVAARSDDQAKHDELVTSGVAEMVRKQVELKTTSIATVNSGRHGTNVTLTAAQTVLKCYQ